MRSVRAARSETSLAMASSVSLVNNDGLWRWNDGEKKWYIRVHDRGETQFIEQIFVCDRCPPGCFQVGLVGSWKLPKGEPA